MFTTRVIPSLRCFSFSVSSRSLLVKQRTKPPLLTFSGIAINQNKFLFTTKAKRGRDGGGGWGGGGGGPTRRGINALFVSLQMIQAIQVLRFHLLELEKVIFRLSPLLPPPFQPRRS